MIAPNNMVIFCQRIQRISINMEMTQLGSSIKKPQCMLYEVIRFLFFGNIKNPTSSGALTCEVYCLFFKFWYGIITTFKILTWKKSCMYKLTAIEILNLTKYKQFPS